MRVIYIAGKYTADTEWGVEQNIRRAERAAMWVWKRGMAAHCPHMNTRRWGGALDYETFMGGDFEILSRCDAVLAVANWKDSPGTKREIEHAAKKNVPVFYNLKDLLAWKEKND